jgi:hypothetical protein
MAKSLHVPKARTHRERTHKPPQPLHFDWDTALLVGGGACSVLLFLSMIWIDHYLSRTTMPLESAGYLSSIQRVTSDDAGKILKTSLTGRWRMVQDKPLYLVRTNIGHWVTNARPRLPMGTHVALLTAEAGTSYLCPADAARGCVTVQP